MKKINNAAELDRAIAELEHKAAFQKKDIQESFAAVSENFKLANLVKSGVRSVIHAGKQEDILNVLLGVGSGFLGRKLLLGKSKGVVGKTIGQAIQWGMAGLVSKNAEAIKEKAGVWIDKLFKKKHASSNHTPSQPPQLNQPED
jgi:uncharacterized coiled-coil protein SlyX